MRHSEQQPIVLGIDPGFNGAVAFLRADDALYIHPTPTLSAGSGSEREYDLTAMKAMLREHPVALAVVEAVAVPPGQGVTNVLCLGYGYGLWVGLLAALEIPFQLIRPEAWKKAILPGSTNGKVAAIAFMQRRYPGVSLLPTPRSRAPHTGMAEAACIAVMARRLLAAGRADAG